MGDLSMAERKKLRLMRFKGQAGMDSVNHNTHDALEKMREQKEKMKARAERFGIVTKEIKEEKIKNRQARFGIETNDSKREKIESRKARFAAGGEAAVEKIDDPELIKKMAERAERFG
jgi:thioredoxin reductase